MLIIILRTFISALSRIVHYLQRTVKYNNSNVDNIFKRDNPGGAPGGFTCPTSRSAGFPAEIPGRPPQFGFYEATYRFTLVTTCRFASPPYRDFVGPLRHTRYRYAPGPSLRG